MAKKDKKKQEKNGAKRQPPPSRLGRHQPFYERILFVVALLGVLVTMHLNLWYGGGAVSSDDPMCGVGFDCSAVLASDPAPLDIPSRVWGLLFYLGMAGLCAGIVYFADAKRLLLKKIRVGMVGIGFLYSLFLTVYQFVDDELPFLNCGTGSAHSQLRSGPRGLRSGGRLDQARAHSGSDCAQHERVGR